MGSLHRGQLLRTLQPPICVFARSGASPPRPPLPIPLCTGVVARAGAPERVQAHVICGGALPGQPHVAPDSLPRVNASAASLAGGGHRSAQHHVARLPVHWPVCVGDAGMVCACADYRDVDVDLPLPERQRLAVGLDVRDLARASVRASIRHRGNASANPPRGAQLAGASTVHSTVSMACFEGLSIAAANVATILSVMSLREYMVTNMEIADAMAGGAHAAGVDAAPAPAGMDADALPRANAAATEPENAAPDLPSLQAPTAPVVSNTPGSATPLPADGESGHDAGSARPADVVTATGAAGADDAGAYIVNGRSLRPRLRHGSPPSASAASGTGERAPESWAPRRASTPSALAVADNEVIASGGAAASAVPAPIAAASAVAAPIGAAPAAAEEPAEVAPAALAVQQPNAPEPAALDPFEWLAQAFNVGENNVNNNNDGNNNNNGGLANDGFREDLTLEELLGLRGPLVHLAESVLWFILFNGITLLGGVFMPFKLGLGLVQVRMHTVAPDDYSVSANRATVTLRPFPPRGWGGGSDTHRYLRHSMILR